ncbi:hypothetical protein FACS1894137_09720 [Spirochaetia bacterium]|nr:hypothetical protein FACS1894137_09720 [Spirochaetia bacterium]
MEIVYDPALYPVGPVNFETETQDFAAGVELRPTRDAQSMLKVIANVRGGLIALGRQKLKAWSPEHDELWLWPRPYAMPKETLFFANRDFRVSFLDNYIYGGNSECTNITGVQADLVNENGKVLATSFVLLTYTFEFELPNTIKMVFYGERDDYSGADAKIWVTRGSGGLNKRSRTPSFVPRELKTNVTALASFQFENVAVHDITDRLTVHVTHIAADRGINLVEWDEYDPPIYRGGTAANLDRKLWNVIDSDTAGKTGVIKITAGPVRNPNSISRYTRTITAEKDEERIR